jgi:hypothetical protein
VQLVHALVVWLQRPPCHGERRHGA